MTTFQWIAAALVGIVSTARLTRLIGFDTWPPAVWFRIQFRKYLPPNWATLVDCPYCLAPYFGAGVLAWAYLSDLHPAWWLFNGWLAGSYIASMVVVHDGEE